MIGRGAFPANGQGCVGLVTSLHNAVDASVVRNTAGSMPSDGSRRFRECTADPRAPRQVLSNQEGAVLSEGGR